MLTQRVFDSQRSQYTLLIGTEPHVVQPLLVSCVLSHARASLPVHVLTPAFTSSLSRLESAPPSYVTVHRLLKRSAAIDCDDQCDWVSAADVRRALRNAVRAAASCNQCLLVVDDVASVLQWCSVHWLCGLLRGFMISSDTAVGRSLMLTVLDDAVCDSTIEALRYHATNTVFVRRSDVADSTVSSLSSRVVVQCDFCGSSSASELVEVCEEEGSLRYVRTLRDIHPTSSSVKQQGCAESSAVHQLCTFKLDLTSSERQARDSLVPPYFKQPQRAESDLGSTMQSSGGGDIVYHPGVEDDWDDEDPDDDLDI